LSWEKIVLIPFLPMKDWLALPVELLILLLKLFIFNTAGIF
jgi:hypothetical protein